MDVSLALLVVIGYFGLLLFISFLTGKDADEQTFFRANQNSPWYLVAFGMIGASLSGVTFLSVPGAVGKAGFGYMQMVFGYLLGYAFIGLVLLPLYYRMNLTSIYGYLNERFGRKSYKSGAVLFLLSRIVGASLRLYLVALVLQLAICDALGIPFAATVFISIALIYIYTFRGGIKTVVWTDTLQTLFMLVSAGLAMYLIARSMNFGVGEMVATIQSSDYSQMLFWDFSKGNHFIKQFLSGAGIAVVMTGLDQDMMQKNLTCRTLGDSQKNMFWFSIVLVFVNLLFVSLGALLYIYGTQTGILEVGENSMELLVNGEWIAVKSDKLFPLISLHHLEPVALAGSVFLLGVIAAAYSSADSALTALTTSFCVDILDFEDERKERSEVERTRIRKMVHLGFAGVLFVVILAFSALSNDAVIWEIFRAAGYTYGPLLGLYTFGLFTKLNVRDEWVPWICIVSPILSYFLNMLLVDNGFELGFWILFVNGGLTFLGLLLAQGRNKLA